HRPHIDQETHEDRNWIAGEAEHRAITDLTEAHWTSGLDRDLPKVTLSDVIDCLRHMVLGALTRSARNHEHVVTGCGILESGAYAIRIRSEEHTSELQSHLNLVC